MNSSGTESAGAPARGIAYRRAELSDLPAVAELFLRAFPQSVEHYVGGPVGPAAMRDAFALCLDAEPAAFIVALQDQTVAGYVFAPSYLPGLLRTALRRGHLVRMAWRALRGGYGLGLRSVVMVIRNFGHLWRDALRPQLRCDARVLSVAVDPAYQGRGLGSALVARALDYLRGTGARCVRLEVRPENAAALGVYLRAGFAVRGRTRDTQGEWLVMLMELD